MPIKPYIPISPPLLPLRRISALIIEEDLSDIDSPDASWFMPSKTYETVTISQKELGPKPVFTFPQFNGQDSSSSEVTTAADTSRRPSISLARLQTRGLDDADIKLPNYNYQFVSSIPTTQQRKRRPSSDVFFHSPLQKSRTYSDNDTLSCSTSSSHSPRSGGRFSGFDSPINYPESDCGCNCDCGEKDYPIRDVFDDDDEEEGEEVVDECHISKSASSEPIEVPKSPNSSHSSHRRRRGCFVEDDVMDTSTVNIDDEFAIVDDEEDDSDDDDEGLMMKDVRMEEDESVNYEGTLEDWIHFAYGECSTTIYQWRKVILLDAVLSFFGREVGRGPRGKKDGMII